MAKSEAEIAKEISELLIKVMRNKKMKSLIFGVGLV